MFFSRPESARYLAPKQPLTVDDAARLRELPQSPYWEALVKLHDNAKADVTTDIIDKKDTAQSLIVLDRFRAMIESYSKEQAPPESSSLM